MYTENDVTGILQAFPYLEDKDDNIICTLLTTTQKRQLTVLINNFLEHLYTLKKGFHIALFSILTPKQAKQIKLFNSESLNRLFDTNYDDAIQYVTALLEIPKSEESNETYWFPTPQERDDETQHTKTQKRILHEMIALQKLEQLCPQDNQE